MMIDNGLPFPTVEWRRASDDSGRRTLFLLNLGHGEEHVTMPPEWNGAEDLLTGESAGTHDQLRSLKFRLLRTRVNHG
jgi:hypothetical protein